MYSKLRSGTQLQKHKRTKFVRQLKNDQMRREARYQEITYQRVEQIVGF